MTRYEAALIDLAAFLDDRQIPYMVIGGLANLCWGAERFTRDVDISVDIADEGLRKLLADLEQSFRLTTADPEAFARRNHLVRMQTRTGVDVDLILAALPYESAAIRRAVPVDLGGRSIRLCSPEDLIVHKLASERTQDAADVEGILVRQAGRLDLAYLRPLVKDLATGLERPGIVAFFEKALAKAEGRTHG
jgi:hypothetical protein